MGRWLHALPFAAVVVDRSGQVVAINAPADDFLGRRGGLAEERPSVWDLFVGSDQGAAAEVHGQVLTGRPWQGELRVVRATGSTTTAHVCWSSLDQPGAEGDSLVVLEEAATAHREASRLAQRLTSLARAAAELLLAKDLDEVTGIVTGHLADAVGATVSTLSIVEEPGRLRLVGMRGGRPGAIDRWRTFAMAGTPAGDSLLAREPLLLTGRDEIRRRYPTLEAAAAGDRTLICLPLQVESGPIGVVTMTLPGRRPFNAVELEFFSVMADSCSQAIDRLRALAAASDRAAKLRFLADATAELASSVDYESTLTNVVQSAVPWFADWCSVALAFDGELQTLAVAHVDPAKVALAREYEERYPPDPAAPSGPYQVLRSGESQLVPEITDEMLDSLITDAEQRERVRALNLHSAISVPLRLGDRALGVMTWVAGEEGRRFTPDDLVFGEDLARRAAVAIDNAQLHTELREMAMRLQRAVLPDVLPEQPGWEIAAHHAPAGHLDVGGDFYDVISLDAGRFALFIGDVMGRGVHAAAAMAQMRSALRALVAVDPDPVSVLTRLDRYFERYELDQLVTMLYMVVVPETDEVLVANAGHLPPVVVHADGTRETVRLNEDRLLGAPSAQRSVTAVPLREGDTLLAFTDGLVERRGEDIDAGQRRLLAASASLASGDVAISLDLLVRELADPDRDDDVAAIVVRRTPAGTDPGPDEAAEVPSLTS